MKRVGLYEARSKLAELVERARRGEVVVLTRNGNPVAELRPVAAKAGLDETVREILELDWVIGDAIVDTIREAREERG